LHEGKGSDDDSNHWANGPEGTTVKRNERNDDAEADQVDENCKKDDKNGRFSHARTERAARNRLLEINNIRQSLRWKGAPSRSAECGVQPKLAVSFLQPLLTGTSNCTRNAERGVKFSPVEFQNPTPYVGKDGGI
jgi:hypothetical protein